MALPETDWSRVVLETAGSLVSGFVGLVVGVWRAGRDSAKKEQKVKDDYDGKIGQLGNGTRAAMAAAEKAADARLENLVEQFKESFDGIRRQFDEHKFYTERDFLKKEDFKDFREEYREDTRDIKRMIADIAAKR